MPSRVSGRLLGIVAGVLIVALAVGVVVLDRRQARRGESSVLALPWRGAAPTAPELLRLAARVEASDG